MAAQQGQNQPDNSLGTLWIVIAAFAIALLLWYVPKTHVVLVTIFFKIKLLEIAVISLFTHGLDVLHSQILHTAAANTNGQQIIYVADMVGRYLYIPFTVLLLIFAFLVYRSNVSGRYRQSFNMQRLLEQEKENWPQITPIAKLNLVDEDLDTGPWAMAMTPLDFAKKYKLLKIEKKATTKTGLSKDVKDVASLIQEKASRVFVRQIGRPWTKPEDLPIYARALFVIFAAKTNAESELADKLLRQIGASASTGERLNFSEIDALLPRLKTLAPVMKLMDSHAYVLTVMASMLQLARTDGVLATAEFLWLKPLDRSLWYMLNTVGRETVVTEVAGAYAHWLAERTIGRKLVVPMVRQATLALAQAIEEVIYVPGQKGGTREENVELAEG